MIRHELDQWLPDAVERAANGKCDGSCEEHRSIVSAFRVRHIKSDTDWGYFAYCEAAQVEDKARGMELTRAEP